MPAELNRPSPDNPAAHSANADVQEAVQQQYARLPGDHGGATGWICPNCKAENLSRPQDGCPSCGAGSDAKLAPPELRSRPLEGGLPSGTADQGSSTLPVSTNLAAKLASRMRGAAPATDLESIRLIVREELHAVLGGPRYTDKEKNAIINALAALSMNEELLDDTLPTLQELHALMERIQQS